MYFGIVSKADVDHAIFMCEHWKQRCEESLELEEKDTLGYAMLKGKLTAYDRVLIELRSIRAINLAK